MKYSIIYTDPCWAHDNKNTGGSMTSGAVNKYPVMSVQDIANLNVQAISEPNSVLFMWWLASMSDEAKFVANSWGFKIKTMTGFSWIKKTVTGKDHFGMGFWTRQQQEHCLIAVRGKIRSINHSVRQNIYAPVGEHSEKPAETRDRIVKLMGDLPRVELFARQKIEGWDAIGNAIDGRDIREVLSNQLILQL